MNANKSITALFTEETVVQDHTVTIAVDGAGSTTPSAGTYTYAHGTTLTITAVADEGAEFAGFSTTGGAQSMQNPFTLTVSSDTTVTAHFRQQVCYLHVGAVNGSVTADPVAEIAWMYPYGTRVTLTAVPDAGYRFSAWDGDAGGSEPTIEVVMDANKMIAALFVPENQDVIRVGVTSNSGFPGETRVPVNVVLHDPVQKPVNTIQFEMRYDPQVLNVEAQDVTVHFAHPGALTNTWQVTGIQMDDGLLYVSLYGDQPLPQGEEGVICIITFNVNQDAQAGMSSSLKLSRIFLDEDAAMAANEGLLSVVAGTN